MSRVNTNRIFYGSNVHVDQLALTNICKQTHFQETAAMTVQRQTVPGEMTSHVRTSNSTNNEKQHKSQTSRQDSLGRLSK